MSSQTPKYTPDHPDFEQQPQRQKSSSAAPALGRDNRNMDDLSLNYAWDNFPPENSWMDFNEETFPQSSMLEVDQSIGPSQAVTNFDALESFNTFSVDSSSCFNTAYPMPTEQLSNMLQVNQSLPLDSISECSSFPTVSASLPSSSLATEIPILPSQAPYPFPAYPSLSSASFSPARSIDTEDDLTDLASSSAQLETGEYRCWDHGCNGRSFSSASNFRRHRQEQAGLRRKWRCPFCGREFTRSTARNNHTKEGNCQQRRQSMQQSQAQKKPRRQSQ